MLNHQQPKGAFLLTFIEIWDRFGYYGIQSVLVLYLTKALLLSDEHAYALYGVYTALAFSTPFLGGYLGDYFFGYQKTVIFGLCFLIIGNLILFLPGAFTLYIGLGWVVCGIGFLKANNATLLGLLYEPGSGLKEKGYTWFYLGMNLGATLGPIVFGLIALYSHWKYGFLVSAMAAAGCLLLFVSFRSAFQLSEQTIEKKSHLKHNKFLILVLFFAIIMLSLLFYFPYLFRDLLWFMGITSVSYLLFLALKQNESARNSIFLLGALNLFALFFFACQVQIGSSLTLFIDRLVDKHLGTWAVPTAAFSSIQPICVIISVPVIQLLWRLFKQLSPLQVVLWRIFLGLSLGSVSFAIFAISAYSVPWSQTINYPLIGIILGNLTLGAGELCIGPAMMVAVSHFAPEKLKGQLMGFWFLSVAFSGYLGSLLAEFSDVTHMRWSQVHTLYAHSFLKTSAIAIAIAIALLISLPILQRVKLAQIMTP